VHTIFWLIESCCHARTRLTAFGMEKEGDVRTGTACHTVTLCPHAMSLRIYCLLSWLGWSESQSQPYYARSGKGDYELWAELSGTEPTSHGTSRRGGFPSTCGR
jgi:hypothetical protein